ncbi:1-acyl-sn-glycerol-3-phosphate acyltransferase [Kitasatospora sp. SolWspMP-SS2h]|nr:1-acyl-sn-glycerol-3-phosphate acyltransferase [Kitasatospora sp. SolWspMP-SS2h]
MFYRLMKMIVAPLLRIFFRPWMEGEENIPDEGPAILASNHLSFSDSFFLPALLKRRVTFIAKAEYFTTPGLKGRLTAAFFKGVGQLPVDRSGARGAGEAAIRSGIAVIERGEVFGVYPEGTRSPDGKLYRGKVGGLARVALATGAPVIPVAMIDTEKVQPPGQVVPNFGVRPGIRIGRPLDFSRYRGMENDRFILRSVTDEVMYEIMRLSGQEYVDIYATAAKRQLAEEKKAADADRKAQQKADAEAGARAKSKADAEAGTEAGADGEAGPDAKPDDAKPDDAKPDDPEPGDAKDDGA